MRKLIYIVFVSILISCVETPHKVIDSSEIDIKRNSIFILSEGLWGMNNAELSNINISSGNLQGSIFERTNAAKLGDVANSMVVKGDTAYIVVTSSHYLVSVDLNTGRMIDTVIFSENAGIRDIAIANDSIAYVTDFYQHVVHKLNLKSMIVEKSYVVGPAPEGIVYYDNKLYIANSGFGDYLANEPNAGTIAVLDLNTEQVDYYYCGPNVIDLVIDESNSRLFASYRHLPSKEDSLGGIVEFDLHSMVRINELRIDKENLNITFDNNRLYYLTGAEFGEIDLKRDTLSQTALINNDSDFFWYSFAVSSAHGIVAIGNAKNYQTRGFVELYDFGGKYSKIADYQSGINPGTVLFY